MMSELICQYCSHRNVGGAISRCTHCGAPLRAAAHKAAAAVEPTAHVVEKTVEKTAGVAETAVKVVAGLPPWKWRVFGVLIAVVVLFGVVVARSCSPSIPSLFAVPQQSAVSALPEALRSAASCVQLNTTEMVQKCVIGASHPLLAGGISGGKELTFHAEVSLPASLSDTIRRWRAGGATVLTDGPVFAAIGPSASAWYADTRSGLRLETGSFSGKAAAQTFLTRAGLVR